MKFGMHYIYWQKELDCKSFLPYVEKTARLGFDVLELGDEILLNMTDDEVLELKKCKDEWNIELAFGLDPPVYGELTSEDDKIREMGQEYYKKVFPRLEILGINQLGGRFLFTSYLE